MADHMEKVREFTTRLVSLYGDDLVSVGLYGSAARGQFREGRSDLNLLVILRRLDAEQLRRSSALAREWAEAGNPPPLMFSEAEWHASADVFPIEYSDIEDAHLVLHGSDPFAEVRVDWDHLRLMCEHEMKAKKIALRERYLFSAEAPEELGGLLLGSISTFIALFRAAIRLTGAPAPREPEAVVERCGEMMGFDPAPMLEVLAARAGDSALAPAADSATVVGYLDTVARASDWLDSLERPTGAAGRS